MAHLTSAASLHTARMLLREYEFVPNPQVTAIPHLTGGESHVAIIIDYASNIFEIALLRPELFYWQKRMRAGTAEASGLATFLRKAVAAFAKLPRDSKHEEKTTIVLEGFHGMKPVAHTLSKPAREVARFLNYYYIIRPRNQTTFDPKIDLPRIAKFADFCLGLAKVLPIVPELELELSRLTAGQATEKEVRICLRGMGVILEALPNYENRQEEVRILYTETQKKEI